MVLTKVFFWITACACSFINNIIAHNNLIFVAKAAHSTNCVSLIQTHLGVTAIEYNIRKRIIYFLPSLIERTDVQFNN